ncbi:hypothetical protein ABDI30_14740 [Paenibacillus cisolokensis]|uniref:hypothetical protein n=1 Tax=Paenibacillus cisolokensis TaxID=1658519 RepID=UPI003D2659A1
MISKVRVLLMAMVILIGCVPFTLNVSEASNSITQEIKEGSTGFNPEKVGNRLNEKGEELFEAVRSGSNFYIYLALAIFLILLIGGLFFKKLLSIAFLILFFSVVGYLIINFWPQIFETVMSILNWLFDKGGTNIEAAPSV